jgi:alkylation response protein AidB-like acyl-CoA dehydrogenase
MSELEASFSEAATRLFHDLEARGAQAELAWAACLDSGFASVGVAEDRGGSGGDFTDVMSLARLAGRTTIGLPLADTMLANALWTRAGKSAFEHAVALGWSRANESLTIARESTGWRLGGAVSLAQADMARGTLLVEARENDGAYRLVALAAPAVLTTALDLGRTSAADDAVGPAQAVPQLRRAGAILRAAEMSGAMSRALDMTIAYANDRVQFGRALGKFQAVQSQLALAASECAAATAVATAAARALDTERDTDVMAAAAKSVAGEAAGIVAGVCHQVHGAIGFTADYPLQLLTRRLYAWCEEFGGETVWRRILGRAVIAGGGTALWPRLTALP